MIYVKSKNLEKSIDQIEAMALNIERYGYFPSFNALKFLDDYDNNLISSRYLERVFYIDYISKKLKKIEDKVNKVK